MFRPISRTEGMSRSPAANVFIAVNTCPGSKSEINRRTGTSPVVAEEKAGASRRNVHFARPIVLGKILLQSGPLCGVALTQRHDYNCDQTGQDFHAVLPYVGTLRLEL